MNRIYVAGCPVDVIDREALTNELLDVIATGRKTQVLGVNAAFVVDSNKDPCYRAMIEDTEWATADGFWVTVAAKVLGHDGVTTVGIERLVYELLPRLGERGGSVYLLGAREEIVHEAAAAIEERNPGITVAGLRNGYFTEEDEEEILADINAADPDVILVGITSPKKEQWMLKFRDRLTAHVTIGVGGLLDVIAGAIPSAPIWIKESGTEWLFRLYHDPKRLLKRYTVGNAQFIWLITKELFGKRFRRTAGASRAGQ